MFKIFFRKITSLLTNGTTLQAKFDVFKLPDATLSKYCNVLLLDGVYSLNKDAKLLVLTNAENEYYSLMLLDEEGLNLIKSLNMNDKDVAIGRKNNYLHFNNTEKLATLKATQIDITNETTNLNQLLTKIVTIIKTGVFVDNPATPTIITQADNSTKAQLDLLQIEINMLFKS